MRSLSSKLDSVTVYREGATCRRLAQVEPSAERQVRLGGLPLSLEGGTLRARVKTGAGKVVDVRPQFDVVLAEEVDVPAEHKAWEAAGAAVAQLELQLKRLSAEVSELQQLRPAFLEPKRGEPPRPAPVEAMLALGELAAAELEPRLEQRRALEERLRDAKEELALRARRVQEASTAQRGERARLSRVAVVTFAEPPAAPLELELEYRVPGARWVPSYALTLERGLTNGTLKMRASVAQNTGEDWAGVQLSLSTASAVRRADMPELKALKIGRRQEPPPRSGWREPPPGLEALFEAYDAAVASAPRPPPQPRPMPKAAPADERSRSGAGRPAAPPPPPGMAPQMLAAAAGAPMALGSSMMPAAAPAPARAAMSRRAEPAPKGGFGGGGERMKKAMKELRADLEEEAAPEMEASAMFDDAGGDAFSSGMAEEPEPEPQAAAGLQQAFADYDRLTMGAPDAPSVRGKLTAAPEWDFAFVAGVSVQVDFVVAVLGRAQQRAHEVQSLSLPAMCNPVRSIDSFDYRYDCAARLDVPSTGKWQLVPVMTCGVGLTPEYVCVPSVEPRVYRTLAVANRSAHALLPGPVDVTAGDEFLMTTTLPAIGPSAERSHRLGLGVEEAIKVARKTQYKETSGGFLGGSTVLPHEVEIELNNRLGAPALIEVRERVPVVEAHEKDLKVDEGQVTPPWEKVEGPVDGELVRGARRWRVTVPPGQQLKLTAQYAIRMPADKMLVGGNRRS